MIIWTLKIPELSDRFVVLNTALESFIPKTREWVMPGKLRTTESLRKYMTHFHVSRWSSCSEQTDRKSSPAASRLEPNEVIKQNMTLTDDSFRVLLTFLWNSPTRSWWKLKRRRRESFRQDVPSSENLWCCLWSPTRNRNWTRNKVRLLHGVTDIYSSKHGKLFYHETKQVRYGQHKKKRRRGNGAPARGRPGCSLDHLQTAAGPLPKLRFED